MTAAWRNQQTAEVARLRTCPIDGKPLSEGQRLWSGSQPYNANAPSFLVCGGYYGLNLCDIHGWNHTALISFPGGDYGAPCPECPGGGNSMTNTPLAT